MVRRPYPNPQSVARFCNRTSDSATLRRGETWKPFVTSQSWGGGRRDSRPPSLRPKRFIARPRIGEPRGSSCSSRREDTHLGRRPLQRLTSGPPFGSRYKSGLTSLDLSAVSFSSELEIAPREITHFVTQDDVSYGAVGSIRRHCETPHSRNVVNPVSGAHRLWQVQLGLRLPLQHITE
jgi:hypothetical protein